MSEQDKVTMAVSRLLHDLIRQDRQSALDAVEYLGLAIDQSQDLPDSDDLEDMLAHVGEGL